MKPLLGTLAVVALCLGVVACGDSGERHATGASATVAPSAATHENDRDNDGDHNDDDGRVLNYGHPASAADRRSSVTLVTRYFAAAAAADGAKACALLVPLTAESVVEEDGHSAALSGRSCAAVMSKLFRLHHRMLVEKRAALEVISVRIEGNKGLAVLDFPEIHEVRQLGVRRVDGAWKVVDLLDGIIE
jgi:hypothetical protein